MMQRAWKLQPRGGAWHRPSGCNAHKHAPVWAPVRSRHRTATGSPRLLGYRQPGRHCLHHHAAISGWSAAFAAMSVSKAAAGSAAAGGTLTAASLPALLTSIGILIICIAGAAFLIAAIPTLWALAQLAHAATAVARQIEKELPDTAALLRLSGIEVTDAISEMSSLGSDLSKGVRSTAQMVTMTERGARQVVSVASQQLAPAVAAGETHARGVLEAGLQERASLNYTLPVLSQVATGITKGVRNLRVGVAVARAATTAVQLGRAVRDRAIASQSVSPSPSRGRSPSSSAASSRSSSPATAVTSMRSPSPPSSAVVKESLNGTHPVGSDPTSHQG